MQPLFQTDHQNFPTHHWYRLLDPSRTTFSPLTSFPRHPRSPAAIRTVPLASGRPALSWNSERLRGRGWLTPVMCSNITPSDWTFRSLRPPSFLYICKIWYKFHNQFYFYDLEYYWTVHLMSQRRFFFYMHSLTAIPFLFLKYKPKQ